MRKWLLGLLICIFGLFAIGFAQEGSINVDVRDIVNITNNTTSINDLTNVTLSTIKKYPNLNQGVAYSFLECDFNYLFTTDLVNLSKNQTTNIFDWRNFKLEGGYSSKNKIVAVISYDFGTLEKYNITIPIVKFIGFRPGIYGGYGRIELENADGSNEFDWGVSATVINIQFG